MSFPPPAAAPPPRAPLRITTGIVRDWSGLLRVIVLALLLLGLPGGLDIQDLIGCRLYTHSSYLLYPGSEHGSSKKEVMGAAANGIRVCNQESTL